MKKIISTVLFAVFAVGLLASCGNMSMGPGNFTFHKIHIDTHHYTGCFTIEKWYDSSTGIEVKTKEAGSLFLAEGTYILLDGISDCPFCKVDKEDE